MLLVAMHDYVDVENLNYSLEVFVLDGRDIIVPCIDNDIEFVTNGCTTQSRIR